jgi:nucleotidyltransferase/DNA polymerase involved in DNA repair
MPTSRLACLRIPKFQIAVHRRHDPSLKNKPFIIMSGKGNRALVVMCSDEALRHQVFSGMKLSEAKAACADLVWRDYDEHLYREAQKKLSRQLIACSPKVTALEPGLFVLDAHGLAYLGGEEKLCREIQKVVGRAGFSDVHIGIADSAFAATVASKFKRRQFYIVPAGEDAPFLAPLTIKHLQLSNDMADSLHDLGIRTMGQLAALGEQSLRQRFGRDGIAARELCQGVDRRQPFLPPLEREFRCFVDIGSAIELLHEVQFVLKSMVDRLTRDLRDQGWWAEELELTFFNDNDKFDVRPIKLLRPSNHAKFLLEVMKLSLEAKPIGREVTAIEVNVTRFSKEAWHQSRLESSSGKVDAGADVPLLSENAQGIPRVAAADSDADENRQLQTSDLDGTSLSLTLMLQRFVSRLGEDAVVKSVPNDSYMPETAGAWLPVAHKPAALPVLPVNVTYINSRTGPTGLAAGLALRCCQPPHPVLVEFQNERPTSLTYHGRWYTVKEITEPERLSTLWWEQSARRSYYVALIEPRDQSRQLRVATKTAAIIDTGLLVMLVNDHEANAWYINGFYD